MASESKFYEMTGIVHKVLDEQTFASGFRKRDLILTNDVGENPKFPKYVPFSFKKERGDEIAHLQQGQRVTVVFVLEGREYQGRYFPDITGIKVKFPDGATEAEPSAVPYDQVADDMPF